MLVMVGATVMCGSGVMNYHVCARFNVDTDQDFMWLYYFSLSSNEFTSTSSHMCGSWYMPMFLFRDGSLTLMKENNFN